MKLALALSGGGVRAAVFHCGVLQRLALDGLLESTTFVSTVSGGSLLVGLILCQNGHRWPGSGEFLDAVLSSVRARLTTATLQWSYTWRSMALPWRLARGRAQVLARQLEAQWGDSRVDAGCAGHAAGGLSTRPATKRGGTGGSAGSGMGDYVTHYVLEPETPIADAIAASAAVPGVIGPLAVRSDGIRMAPLRGWPARTSVDAGETLRPVGRGGSTTTWALNRCSSPAGGFRDGFDFLLVSDASAPLSLDPRRPQANVDAVASCASAGRRCDGAGARAASAVADCGIPAVPGLRVPT